MAVKERGCVEHGHGRERHAWNVKGRSCVPVRGRTNRRTRKSRGSLTSQILITCDRPRVLVRVTRPCARGYTRENSVVYTSGFIQRTIRKFLFIRRDLSEARFGRSEMQTVERSNFQMILSNLRREEFIT